MAEFMSPFQEDGFRSGFVVLPGINMGIQMLGNEWFRYDGPVKSLSDYIKTLPDAIREHLQGFDYRKMGGFNYQLSTDAEVGYMMATLDISPRANIFTQAHEAAEIAVRLRRIAQLQQYVDINTNRGLVDLSDLSQHEVGNVCGFVATVDAGYSADEVVRLIELNEDKECITLLKRLNLI